LTALIDLTGQRFGKLVAIRREGSDNHKSATWYCNCDCGTEGYIASQRNLAIGIVDSCGCDSKINIDFTGMRFTRLVVIKEIESDSNGHRQYLCKCDCGNDKVVTRQHLQKGSVKSCGCLKRDSEDLTGQKFGRWTVIEKTKTRGHGVVYYLCECECGTRREVLNRGLKYGKSLSCGCLTREISESQAEDLTGMRFGKLTAVKIVRRRMSNGITRVYWDCYCDCGKNKIAAARDLKLGGVVSCGCLKKYNDDNNYLKIYLTYTKSAEKRNLVFELTPEEFKNLIFDNCYYCGEYPSNKIKFKKNLTITYNGIDRVDNSIGYILSNCVSCCAKCNRTKMEMNVGDFIAWIKKAYYNIEKKGL
jgi:hypothetical protein